MVDGMEQSLAIIDGRHGAPVASRKLQWITAAANLIPGAFAKIIPHYFRR
jgi:hypothetical protein